MHALGYNCNALSLWFIHLSIIQIDKPSGHVNTFKRLLILDNVGMTHFSKNSHFFSRFLPLFAWHLTKLRGKMKRMRKPGKEFRLLVKLVEYYTWGAYSRYANLLDDKLASILFWFDKDGLSKRTFSNFLHLFVLVHVTGMTDSSCWICKEMKEHAAALCLYGLVFS